jgi:raffinose/stachyose/melibiose transport system permease protein
MNGAINTGEDGTTRATRILILAVLILFTILPLLSMITTALHQQGTSPSGLAWPAHPQWHNFVDAWNAADLLALLKSSILIVLGVVPAAVIFSTLAGYGLSAARLRGGSVIYGLFILGLTLPAEALVAPLYYELQGMDLLNSRWALIFPLLGLFMPFGVFWMRAAFQALPVELTEAAELDGASAWQAFRRVKLPLVLPSLSSLSILFFLWTWNQFLLVIVLINNPADGNMAGALATFQGEHGTNVVLLCAGAIIIMAPSLVIFFVFQRQFVRALLQGAVK